MAEIFRIYKGDTVVKEGESPLSISGLGANVEVESGEYKATRVDGKRESVKINIPPFTTLPIAVTSVTLDKTTANVPIGGSVKLTQTVKPDNATDKSGNWASSNTAVATVSGGTVTIKADAAIDATSDITFTTKDGNKIATCKITVTEAQG